MPHSVLTRFVPATGQSSPSRHRLADRKPLDETGDTDGRRTAICRVRQEVERASEWIRRLVRQSSRWSGQFIRTGLRSPGWTEASLLEDEHPGCLDGYRQYAW